MLACLVLYTSGDLGDGEDCWTYAFSLQFVACIVAKPGNVFGTVTPCAVFFPLCCLFPPLCCLSPLVLPFIVVYAAHQCVYCVAMAEHRLIAFLVPLLPFRALEGHLAFQQHNVSLVCA